MKISVTEIRVTDGVVHCMTAKVFEQDSQGNPFQVFYKVYRGKSVEVQSGKTVEIKHVPHLEYLFNKVQDLVGSNWKDLVVKDETSKPKN